ncbi:polysaccharide biosynthesis protein [Pseudomonas sp. FGI182]|uniref:oligosaccharide flippase family protein n=1 Tax=Pseudomonas sp. FGI182 TaxID=1259844 RepID=UPI0003D8E672|nr:oligosaccharide flippase family protein [Pseudomonas sp. FGI182]AHD13428.1 polysaccharide biosynthesis protein [Pseudomonas sp. FGI182]
MKVPVKLDHLSKATGILMGGTALGQAILLLALPLLTRLYTPEHFNVLAVYVAIVGVFAGAACLRLDVAISIPETADEARQLLVLAVTCASIVSVAVATGVWAVGELFSIDYGVDREFFSLLVGAGLFSIGALNAFQVWYVREKKFMSISLVKLSQAILSVMVQVAFGLLEGKTYGLLLGYIANSAVGASAFAMGLLWKASQTAHIALSELKKVFKDYSRFPKYSTLESLANEGASQVPILLIAFFVGGAEAGFLMLAARVLQAPIALLGNAVSQVFLSEAPEKERQGVLGEFALEMMVRLAKVGVGPLIAAGLLAPVLFPVVFGSQWQRSGELISWMTPWFIAQFMVSPVSLSLHVKGRQKVALVLQVFALVFRVAVVGVCVFAFSGFVVEAYAISGFIVYVVYLLCVLKVVGLHPLSLLIALKRALLPVVAFTGMGLCVLLAFGFLQAKGIV